MSISRREFLEATTLSVAAGSLTTADGKTSLPTRILGRTGARVSILAMGGGSRFLMYKDEDKALEAANRALELGITYIDTSDDYGRGRSEERIGKAVKGRRKSIFLATKLSNRDGAQARRIVEGSLKRLQVNQVDLIHIHSLLEEDDLARIEAKGGVLEQLMKMRDEKLMRFVGITSHTDPTVLKTALERHDFDCTQMALNAARAGMKGSEHGMVPNDAIKTSFEKVALPVAKRKKMGVIAMKTFAQETLLADATPEELLFYAWSLPVTTAVVGMPKLAHIDDNVRLAKLFKPLPKSEMERISNKLAAKYKLALDRFYANHVDA